MGISLKQAMLFVPKNDKWIRTLLIGGLLLFCPTFAYVFPGIRRMIFDPVNYFLLALFVMFTIVVSVAVTGYFFKTIHNRVIHDKEGLPDWQHFDKYLKVGLNAYIGGIVLSLPFLCFGLLLLLFTPMTLSKEIIPFLIVLVIMHIIYTFLYIMVALNFVVDLKMSSFFDFRRACFHLKDNISNFVLLVVNCLFLAIIHLILTGILINAQIFALLIPFISFYVYLVYTDLFAQFVQLKERGLSHETECIA